MVAYLRTQPRLFVWCNTHRRIATHVRQNYPGAPVELCCDPALDGIAAPCHCTSLCLGHLLYAYHKEFSQ